MAGLLPQSLVEPTVTFCWMIVDARRRNSKAVFVSSGPVQGIRPTISLVSRIVLSHSRMSLILRSASVHQGLPVGCWRDWQVTGRATDGKSLERVSGIRLDEQRWIELNMLEIARGCDREGDCCESRYCRESSPLAVPPAGDLSIACLPRVRSENGRCG